MALLAVKEWIWELFWLTAWITCSMLGDGGSTRGSGGGKGWRNCGQPAPPSVIRPASTNSHRPQRCPYMDSSLFQQTRKLSLDFLDLRLVGDDDGHLICSVAARAVEHQHLADA